MEPSGSGAPTRPIRLSIQQPALPKYRLPVFQELSRRQGIELTLYYGALEGLPNVEPTGIRAVSVPVIHQCVGGHKMLWHRAQWEPAHADQTDVLCLSWDLHYLSLIPALLRARKHGVSTLLWGHGYSKNESPLRLWVRRAVTHLATAILFYNDRTAKQYIDAGTDPRRVFVAPNSLDQSTITHARNVWLNEPARLQDFQSRHGIQGLTMLLFVSRLDPANRIDLLLHAVAQLGESVGAAIIGDGPDLNNLKRLATSLGIESRIKFTGPIYNENELAPWFLSSYLFCYPDNLGLSILHAMGYGLPVITGNRIESQNPEIEALCPGHNGMFFQMGNVESLADTIRSLMNNCAQRDRMSVAALQTVRESYSITHMVDGFVAAVRYCAGVRAE